MGIHRHRRVAIVFVAAVLASACAAPSGSVSPRIARLPAEEIQKLPSAAPAPLSADELVAMVRAGATSETIVERWRQATPRLAMTPTRLIDLHRRGVPLPILETLAEAHERALRADYDTVLAQRQSEWERKLAEERNRPRQCPSPYGWGPYPYGVWGVPGPARGGVYWGW